MGLQASFSKKTFHFSFRARTSQGAISVKDSWFLRIWDSANPEIFGIGEASPLSGLSAEEPEDVEDQLSSIVSEISKISTVQQIDPAHVRQAFKSISLSSSVLFALEVALQDLRNGGSRVIFQNSFLKGQRIPINGLVWMGGLDFMLQQVSIKIDDGFSCIKVKIGGINFEKELDILQFIRRKYFRDTISIRLDANGAFKPHEALYKLMDCSRYDVHSIEQPLKPGSPLLPELCKQSPIPIALDEELIGVVGKDDKIKLLERVSPAYIILKPTLHGGISGCQEWINVAEERKIGWWMTSALETNIGLNAVAQFSANFPINVPQGLGTGTIYTENIPSPLQVEKGHLMMNSQENWDLSILD